MILKFGKLFAMSGLVAMAALSTAQVAKAGAGYTFRMKFAPGVTNYAMVATMIGMPGATAGKSMKMTSPISMNITNVVKGVADMTVKTGPMLFNGQPVMQAVTQKVKVDQYGKAVGSGSASSQLFPSGLPTGPVKIGQTWKSTITMPGSAGGQKVTANYRFAGIQSVGSVQCARLDMTMTGASAGKGSTYLNVANGMMVKVDMTMNQQMQPGTKPIKVVIAINRK